MNPQNDMTDDVLISYLLEEADSATREHVEQWIDSNAANRRYFDSFRLIWETSKQLQLPDTVDEQQALQRFRQRTIDARGKPANSRVAFNRLRLVAAVLTAACLLTVAWLLWDKTTSAPVTLASAGAAVANTLPDGSMVTLNRNSVISYAGRFRGRERKITLKGEAFFNVATDKRKPFVVEVNGMKVSVLGTSFNIKTIDGKTEVVVETGVVKVEKDKHAVLLRANEKVVVSAADTAFNKQRNTDKPYNYYRSREFVCDDTPLWKLVEILNEAYGSDIIIENERLKTLPLTATFHNESLANILAVISETFNIRVDRDGERVILR